MSAEDAVKSTTDDLRALLTEAEKLLSSAGETADDKVQELRDRLRAAIDEGRSSFERVQATARDQLDTCDHYVRQNPYYAIGVAAVLGGIVGLLLARR